MVGIDFVEPLRQPGRRRLGLGQRNEMVAIDVDRLKIVDFVTLTGIGKCTGSHQQAAGQQCEFHGFLQKEYERSAELKMRRCTGRSHDLPADRAFRYKLKEPAPALRSRTTPRRISP